MPDAPSLVRTRFAPSPSGHLHVGGARTALYCWAYARAKGGRFVLRIEDTDQKRSSETAGLAFLEDLAWLGLTWDEGPLYEGEGVRCGGGPHGPYRQSERRPRYDDEIDRMLAAGLAYRAFETPEELDAARERARAAGRDYRYDRAALALAPPEVERLLAEGRPHVVRFRVPDGGDVVIPDRVLGDVRVPRSEIDDFVIRKADGFPTYHFAVVVDDALMEITHVIRGQEHLKNTARHILLQDALDYPRPVFAHLSIIFNPDGSKMSKRDKDKALRAVVSERGVASSAVVDADTWAWWRAAKDRQLDPAVAARLAEELGAALPEIEVDDFRRAGYLPEVLLNYLALLGWSPPGENVEKFGLDELVEHFDIDRMTRSPAKFDRDKLLAFNLDAIQAMPPDEFAARYVAHLERYHPVFVARLDPDRLRLLAAANQGRSKTLDDQIESCRFFVTDDDAIVYEPSKAVRKALGGGEPSGAAHLEAVAAVLAGLTAWTVESLEAAVTSYADEHAEGKLGRVAQPLRIAVSGGTISPAIFETLAILGRESVLARIARCLAARETLVGC